jgi:hypothetical protein
MPPERTPSSTFRSVVGFRAPDHKFLPLPCHHRKSLEHHDVQDMAMCDAGYHAHRERIYRFLPERAAPGDGPHTLLGMTKKLAAAMSPPELHTDEFEGCLTSLNLAFDDVRNVQERGCATYDALIHLARRNGEDRAEGAQLLESTAESYKVASISVEERRVLARLQTRLDDMSSAIKRRVTTLEVGYRHARLINYASGLRIKEATGVRLPPSARGPSRMRRKLDHRAPILPPQAMIAPGVLPQPAMVATPEVAAESPVEWDSDSDEDGELCDGSDAGVESG